MKIFMVLVVIVAIYAVASGIMNAEFGKIGGEEALMHAAPTSAATITRTATAGPDYLATAQAEKESAVSAAEVSRRAELDAQQAAIYAQETAQAAQVQALQLTATLGAQQVEIARIHATEAAVIATRNSDARLDWIAKETATAAAPALLVAAREAEAKADAAALNAKLEPWLKLATMLAIVAALALAVVVIISRQPRQVVMEAEALPVTHITRGSVTERIEPPPCTALQFGVWSRWMLGGGSAALDEWETAGSPFVGSEYRLGLYKWAVKNQMIAVIDRRQVLTEKGREYCQAHETPSPTEELSR